MPKHRLAIPLLALASLIALPTPCAYAGSPPRPKANDTAPMRETLDRIPVPTTNATIVVRTFKPDGAGPFPWIVLSHGTSPDRDRNRQAGHFRNVRLIGEWVRRGYAVFVPVRRGYGESGGGEDKLGDDYGGCARPDFFRAGEGAALDLLATVDFAKSHRDVDPRRWMLVGQSAGGFASLYTASKQPAGLVAVLAFSSGRGGDPDKRPREPCASDKLAALYRAIAPKVTVPVLFFYAENDEYIGPRVQKLWFDSFRGGNPRAELIVVPPFAKARGHGVFTSTDGVALWSAAVRRFFANQAIAMPF